MIGRAVVLHSNEDGTSVCVCVCVRKYFYCECLFVTLLASLFVDLGLKVDSGSRAFGNSGARIA